MKTKTLLLTLTILLGATFVACGSDAEAVTIQCSDAASADNQDRNGDGFSACQGDCDDNDPHASPDGIEESQTDGYDQDCDNYNPTRE